MTPRSWLTICAVMAMSGQIMVIPTATYNLLGVAVVWAILAIAWRPQR